MLPKVLQTLSIRTQLVALALLVATLALSITGVMLFSVGNAQQRDEQFNELTSLATLLANRSAAALAFLDERTAAENLAALKDLPHIGQACMFNAEGKEFSRYVRDGQSLACVLALPFDTPHRAIDEGVMSIQVPVTTGDSLNGALLIRTIPAPWSERQSAQLRSLLMSLGGALLIAVLAALLLAATVSAPIVRIREITRRIVASKDFSPRAPDLGSNELGDLASTFNAMLATIEQQNRELEERVLQRTAELATANEALQEAINTLTRTQQVMIQQEKLASLGSLVAGIAHELNTPIGTCVLSISTLSEELATVRHQIGIQTLTRRAMENFLEDCTSVTDLVGRNLAHAAELIGNFKQVAVDQASDQRRRYDLATVICEVVDTLRPQLKRTRITLALELTPGIAMDSYPGSLGQVLTNLVLNAKLHAFDEDQEGCIRISTRQTGEQNICITVSDDGMGIPAENCGRIFDPFFTTRLGKGGSGLGLSIVFNLVTGRLGGHISVQSTLGEGATFTIDIPQKAPKTLPDESQ